ncbi:MAG TPA: 2-oxoacid:ferredoxin oxidoreductase subunit beta [Tepidisphaeraceae bacterium]|nr:2-oxoacid:ferredoxin oxidoreductase subunit beta [Tepidisphaeraceae bacterium]
MSTSLPIPTLKPADFASDQDVRWCPGCGDYSILAQTKKVLAKLGVQRENTVFVSGIGCSSRFPYYMNTYGMHSIHGRAPTFATGLKLARPELNVWLVTGDGDGLSIGGNHMLHVIRRNLDVKILLFNNRVYGLTKGQYSPTSVKGMKTKSSPMGTLDAPVYPICFALGCGVTFAARAVDTDVKQLEYVLERAAKHRGTAFVEIYQNCNIFNDGAFDYATDKDTKLDHVLYLEHGKPLVFGKNRDKGIRLNALEPEVVNITPGQEDGLIVHDEKSRGGSLAYLLSRMQQPDYPEAMGIFRATEHDTYDELVHRQITDAKSQGGEADLQTLLNGSETWTV